MKKKIICIGIIGIFLLTAVGSIAGVGKTMETLNDEFRVAESDEPPVIISKSITRGDDKYEYHFFATAYDISDDVIDSVKIEVQYPNGQTDGTGYQKSSQSFTGTFIYQNSQVEWIRVQVRALDTAGHSSGWQEEKMKNPYYKAKVKVFDGFLINLMDFPLLQKILNFLE